MGFRSLLVLVVVSYAVLSCSAFAQNSLEVGPNYSFVIYHPAKSLADSRTLNAGGGYVGYNFGDYFTFKAEFEHYNSTKLTFHLTDTSDPATPKPVTVSTQGNMFTYMFGPQVNIPMHKKRFFGEALFGGANTNAYADLFKSYLITSHSAANNGFAMAIGGGLDFVLSKHFGVRPIQLDYFMTRYAWKYTVPPDSTDPSKTTKAINNQSNFRYQGGVIFNFGVGSH